MHSAPPRVAPETDLKAILERTQNIALEIVQPLAAEIDSEAKWPETALRALQQAGLGGLVVSQQHGGLGYGLHATALVCEILGRECASTALCYGMHLVASAVISAKATDDQQREFLDPINAGEHLTTLALSEPGTGAHLYLPETVLTEDGDGGFLLNGTKSFVTNGAHADSYVVSTVAAESAGPGQFSCILVPNSTPGLSWSGLWNGFGMRGNSSLTAELSNAEVPRSHLLGNPGDQIWYVFEVVAPFFLMAMAGTYLGIASAAFETARVHLRSRVHTHTTASLASQQVLQHNIGRLWAMLERTRRFVYQIAAEADSKAANILPGILSAKAEVAEAAVQIVNEAMTLTGGIGYRDNSRLTRCLRDVRAAHVMSPTTELLRIWTGRALLDQPLLGD